MKIAETGDKKEILKYLRQEISACVYLYIDILNYDISTDKMTVWIEQSSKGIQMVVMKYYDSFQIYSHDRNCSLDGVVQLIEKYRVSMISGQKEIIERLENICLLYKASYGKVFLMDGYRQLNTTIHVERAFESQARQIAELICMDKEIGSHYKVEDLEAQLVGRFHTGTGRSYIIKDKEKIVAHSATYAETEDIAVVGGTIILPEYRNTEYYMVISNYILEKLLKEGKKVFTFAASDRMIRYHEVLHKSCEEYGKLELKKHEEKEKIL